MDPEVVGACPGFFRAPAPMVAAHTHALRVVLPLQVRTISVFSDHLAVSGHGGGRLHRGLRAHRLLLAC